MRQEPACDEEERQEANDCPADVNRDHADEPPSHGDVDNSPDHGEKGDDREPEGHEVVSLKCHGDGVIDGQPHAQYKAGGGKPEPDPGGGGELSGHMPDGVDERRDGHGDDGPKGDADAQEQGECGPHQRLDFARTRRRSSRTQSGHKGGPEADVEDGDQAGQGQGQHVHAVTVLPQPVHQQRDGDQAKKREPATGKDVQYDIANERLRRLRQHRARLHGHHRILGGTVRIIYLTAWSPRYPTNGGRLRCRKLVETLVAAGTFALS